MPLAHASVAICAVFGILYIIPALGINNHVSLVEKLVGYFYGCFHIAAAIFLQVEYQMLHSFASEMRERIHELTVCSCGKIADTDITNAGTNHINCIDRI